MQKEPRPTVPTLDEECQRVIEGRHHDPFTVLGCHASQGQLTVRVYAPRTSELSLVENGATMRRIGDSDIFVWQGAKGELPKHYRLQRTDSEGYRHQYIDPYSFEPALSDFDLNLFSAGKHLHIYQHLGAHLREIDGVSGVLFATWAPNAERVSVIGNFNHWDGRSHPMRSRGASGVWELFIPGLGCGEVYKFEIRNRNNGVVSEKSDPYAQSAELRPRTASVVMQSEYEWQDDAWMQQRQTYDWQHSPISVYEVHLGSWRRNEQGDYLDYRELAHRLVSHVKHMGFTHIELLPITEHPLDDSWGYQTTGYFAPTSRFGSADDFRYFVDHCHSNGIGVYLDWVPAHFPKDAHGLASYDGEPLYEHADPRRGEHPDWGTLIYDYGRNEVRNFLISSAIYWLQEFHLDGLRVDAVASMLYLDYSREAHEWVPNYHGGNENLEAITFFRELNTITHRECPGSVVVAEESTAWPAVTRPIELGGLGFSMKWNMGWMHDTLNYMAHEPIHRTYHHDSLTFGLLYLFTENFMLPFSHDEVVHGKRSLLYRMPGDEWQRFANLRLLYLYMFTYPGKKLLFMGCEFAQGDEWNFRQALDWYVLDYPLHHGILNLVTDLNHLYRQHGEFHQYDFGPEGFEWIDCHDSQQSILAYLRRSESGYKIVVLNFTPVVRHDYRIGVPEAGTYREVMNSDSEYYGGSNTGNEGWVHSEAIAWMGRPHSLQLTLPPLGALVLEVVKE